MEESNVRRRILDDHMVLRERLAEVDLLARRALGGEDGLESEIRELGMRLQERFLRHLDLEDTYLVPALRTVDAWGEERASRVEREHRQQREQMAFLLGDLRDERRNAAELAQELLDLVAAILSDMEHEEQAVLSADLLRDDVVSVDAEGG